jgi:RNA polymerase primary sigma factor
VNPRDDRRLLTATEEIALAQRVERGDLGAKEAMIESNLRLVHAVARTHRGNGVPFADLVQEGTLGLVRAVERFDHRRGLRFSTYAMWWIRHSIRDAVGDSRMIRIPPKARQQLAAVRRAEAELGRADARHASDAAISELARLSPRTVRSLRTAGRVIASLDEPIGEDARLLGDVIADDRAIDPAENLIAQESRHEVTAMLRLLPERHREVLIRRYGLDDGRARSHEEIGAWLGVGPERSRQIERDALHRLRAIAATSARAA